MIRVVLPAHLRKLARVDREVTLEVEGPATQRAVLDALEARYPVLRGTIRDHVTQQRRPFVRFFACEEDLSHEPPDALLPEAVATGAEPFLVVGAMAVDSLDPGGLYFGTTGGQVYGSANGGDSWAPIVRDLPAVLSVEVQTLP